MTVLPSVAIKMYISSMTTRKFDFATENYLKIGALYLEEAPLRSALSTSSQQSYYSIKQF